MAEELKLSGATDYRALNALNQSSLKLLERSPREFKRLIIDGEEPEEDTKNQLEGSVNHKLLFQPETFSDEFVVADSEKPISKQQKEFLEEVSYSDETPDTEELREIYGKYYPIKSKSEEKVDKEIQDVIKKYSDYLEQLRKARDKTLITKEQHEIASNCIKSVKENPTAKKHVTYDDLAIVDEYEKEVSFEFSKESYLGKLIVNSIPEEQLSEAFPALSKIIENNSSIPLKAKLDHLRIQGNKEEGYHIEVIDLKTTKSDLKSFKNSEAIKDDLRLQLAFYMAAAVDYAIATHGVQPDNLSGIGGIIVAVSTKQEDCRCFYLTKDDMDLGIKRILECLENYCWHKENNIWTCTKEEYQVGGEKL